MVRQRLTDLINGHVQLKKQRPLLIVSYHALNPEKGSKPGTTRYGCHVMQTTRRDLQDHLTGRELHGMRAIQVVDHEFHRHHIHQADSERVLPRYPYGHGTVCR